MIEVKFSEVVNLQTVHCADCGVLFALTVQMETKLRETGGAFYCPNGHNLNFGSRLKDLERKLAAKDAELSMARSNLLVVRQECEAAEAKHAKLKRRVTNGVCPCCHRTFRQLAAHIKRQHPGMVKS